MNSSGSKGHALSSKQALVFLHLGSAGQNNGKKKALQVIGINLV